MPLGVLSRLALALTLTTLAPQAVAGDAPQEGGVSVSRYGAKGDGVADDAPAIQAALDKEGRAFLPPGTYRLGSRLAVTRDGGGLVGAGAGATVLRPDASLTKGTLIVLSPSNQTLTDILIADFTLDGSSDPAKVQGMGIYSCKRVRVRGISPVRISGMVHLEGVENFAITDIAGSDLIEFISMNTIKKGVISNVRADGADEGFDFFNCEDVEVVGAVISAREPTVIRPEVWAVGVDLSSSRRVTVSDCTFSGQYAGIKIKHDVVVGLGAPPVEDVLISGCQIRDYKGAGVLLAVETGRGCRIQGCDIRSSRKDTTGIYGFLEKTSKLDDLVISDCTIESAHTGIRFNSYDGAEVRDCRITAGAFHAIKVYECADLVVSGCRLRSPRDSAVILADVANPVVEGCDIAGAAGVWVTNCRRPVVRRNTIPRADGRGVTVEWTSESGLDTSNRVAGFVVDDNTIRNWGGASAGNPAIAVSFSGLSGAAYNQGSVSGNRLLLDSGATLNTQYGVSFARGGLAAIDWVKAENNLIYGPYAAILGAESLGPNSVQAGNTFKQNLP